MDMWTQTRVGKPCIRIGIYSLSSVKIVQYYCCTEESRDELGLRYWKSVCCSVYIKKIKIKNVWPIHATDAILLHVVRSPQLARVRTPVWAKQCELKEKRFNSTYVMMVCFFKGIISENAIFVIYKSHRLDYSNPKAWFKWSFFWLYERGNRLSRCNCVCVYSAGALPQCNWWRILKREVWREGIVRLLTHVQYISTQNLHPLVHGKEIKLTGSQ